MGLAKPSPLFDAGMVLARNGIYGLAWLDAELIVTARFGDLTDRLEVGAPLTQGMPFVADYIDDIHALPADTTRSFELPGIVLVGADGTAAPRIDLHVFRLEADTAQPAPAAPDTTDTTDTDVAPAPAYLVLVCRASSQAANDMAVARYQRERQMLREQIAQQKQELERVNSELELCNRDLEDFAAIISHDLKAPMRGLRYLADEITTLAGAPAASPGEPDAPAGQTRLAEACAALKDQSRRMSDMLSGLLDYASLGRQKEAREKTDTHAVVQAVVASLPRPTGFAIEITGDWPHAITYRAPLDLTLRNLIDNAIKHHDAPHNGRIEIACAPTGDELVISIDDNGPGIPRGRHEAVFYPFRSYPIPAADAARSRAENDANEDSPASHGMGLAFVKRTVETAGGRISLTSDPKTARGTRFDITWPVFAADDTNSEDHS